MASGWPARGVPGSSTDPQPSAARQSASRTPNPACSTRRTSSDSSARSGTPPAAAKVESVNAIGTTASTPGIRQSVPTMAATSAGRSRARRGRSCRSTPADRAPRNATQTIERSGRKPARAGTSASRSCAPAARMIVVMPTACRPRHPPIGRHRDRATNPGGSSLSRTSQRPENSSEISAASAALGRQALPAAAFCADLLGARRARDHARHGRLREQPAECRLEHRDATGLGEGAIPIEHVPGRVVDEVAPLAHDAGVGRLLVAAELAGEQAVLQGEVRQEAESEVTHGRQHLSLCAAREEVVLVLRRDEPRRPELARDELRLGDLPPAEVRVADVAHLARAHEFVEGGDRLVDRRLGIGSVELVEIDPVGLQPAQRPLDGEADVAPRSPGAPCRQRRREACVPELRRDDDLVTAAAQRGTEERLAEAVLPPVDVGGVDEVDAGIEGC